MKLWLYLLAGPLIWLVHFMAMYGFASIEHVDRAWPLSLSVALTSLACFVGAAWVVGVAWHGPHWLCRDAEPSIAPFLRGGGGLGGGIAMVAVLWQTAPAVI